MRGVVFLGDRQVGLESFPDPTPGPGEVVLEIKASGMCGSDLKFYRSAPGEAQTPRSAWAASASRSSPATSPAAWSRRVGPGVTPSEARVGQRVMDHHYCRLRRLQALPRRLVAAVPGRHHGLRRHRQRRARAST